MLGVGIPYMLDESDLPCRSHACQHACQHANMVYMVWHANTGIYANMSLMVSNGVTWCGILCMLAYRYSIKCMHLASMVPRGSPTWHLHGGIQPKQHEYPGMIPHVMHAAPLVDFHMMHMSQPDICMGYGNGHVATNLVFWGVSGKPGPLT